MEFIRFYYLENYLFTEVHDRFHERGFLEPEEFFCIVIWKANRAKGKIKRKLEQKGKLGEMIKLLCQDIHKEKAPEDKINILIDKWNLRLPMASAVLTVLYPNDFTVYDFRVLKQIGMKDFSNRKNQIERYFSEFLPKVKQNGKGKTLRDKDKYLWGKSFYADLKGLLKED